MQRINQSGPNNIKALVCVAKEVDVVGIKGTVEGAHFLA